MLNQTIVLLSLSLALLAITAYAGARGLAKGGGRRLVWSCLLLLTVALAVRNGLPLWVAINVGLYDFIDALLAFAAAFSLSCAAVALLRVPSWR